MNTKWETYKALELISEPISNSSRNSFSLRFYQTCTAVTQQLKSFIIPFLTEPRGPQIEQVINRQGDSCWRIYDPITHQTAYLESEEEVYIWLDQQWYE